MAKRRFSSSVPNTFAAGLASLTVGWGGLRRDAFIKQEWVQSETDACECGLLKLKSAEGCFRCLSIDQLPETTKGLILRALEDFEAASTDVIVVRAKRTKRHVLRCVVDLQSEGRVRGWIEHEEAQDGSEHVGWGKHLVKGRFAVNRRMWRRVW